MVFPPPPHASIFLGGSSSLLPQEHTLPGSTCRGGDLMETLALLPGGDAGIWCLWMRRDLPTPGPCQPPARPPGKPQRGLRSMAAAPGPGLSSLSHQDSSGPPCFLEALSGRPRLASAGITAQPLHTSYSVVVQSLSHVRIFVTPQTAAPRPPCPSRSPGACSNSCPSSR